MGAGSPEPGRPRGGVRPRLRPHRVVRFVVPSVIDGTDMRRWWAGQLVIRLAGYVAEGRPDWPPTFEVASTMDTAAGRAPGPGDRVRRAGRGLVPRSGQPGSRHG